MFEQWKARINKLTIPAIRNAVRTHRFSTSARRRKAALVEEAAALQGELRQALESAVSLVEGASDAAVEEGTMSTDVRAEDAAETSVATNAASLGAAEQPLVTEAPVVEREPSPDDGVGGEDSVDYAWRARLARLPRRKIDAALRGYSMFSREARRNKESFVAEVSLLRGQLRAALELAVCAHENGEDGDIDRRRAAHSRRRRRASIESEAEAEAEREGTRVVGESGASTIDRVLEAIESYNPNTSRFMDLPTPDDVRLRHQLYRNATSNDALAQCVCVACAREVWKRDAELVLLCNVNNKDALKPWKTHVAHELVDGMLLVKDKLIETPEGTAGMFCDDCLRCLRKKHRPPLALANNMWIGDVPEVISCLTIPEQMLIALHYPRCFIFKLFPKNGSGGDPDTLQRGIVGNVTTYALNTGDVVKMLEGNLLPRPPELLASVIAVSFIGLGKLPKKWLKGTFRVRRSAVHAALQWLKANNELYEDIEISNEALQILPEDGVPEEILANVRQEESDTLAERERETYVPRDATDDEIRVRVNESTSSDDREDEIPLLEPTDDVTEDRGPVDGDIGREAPSGLGEVEEGDGKTSPCIGMT